jgi:pyruvate dehydrogenase E2 component (dihydrolipoamide acetyltransferase)
MQEFKLPDLGEGMQEAEIRRWLVKPGDTLKLDQPMVEVETDKAVVEIPSPVSARVADIRVPEGKVAKLGEVLVVFEAETPQNGGSKHPSTLQTPTTTSHASATAASSSTSTASTGAGGTTRPRVLAAPAVRKRAFELGIDLEQVPSSHPSGRVTMEDVQAYSERMKSAAVSAPPPSGTPTPATGAPLQSNGATRTATMPTVEQKAIASEPAAAEERQPLTGLRRRIAERMERSWRTIPHACAFDEVDGTELMAFRQALKPIAEKRGVRLTYMPLLVKLLMPALKEFPIFNASLDEEKREIVYKRSYHIGIATDAPEGLLVPVLRDADKLTLIEVAKQLEHLIEAAQKRTLTVAEAGGSTFTLNNVGSFGGSSGTPIINYPESAILLVGRMQEKAIVQNGAVIVRPMIPVVMSFDHRLIDGVLAGKFLARFKELVEHPQQLMLDMV